MAPRDMATGPDDVRFQGKTGSSRPTAKVTRLTQKRHCRIMIAAALLGRRPVTSNPAARYSGQRRRLPARRSRSERTAALSDSQPPQQSNRVDDRPRRGMRAPYSKAQRRPNFGLCAQRVETGSRFHQCRDVRRDRGSQALESIAAFEHRNYLAR